MSLGRDLCLILKEALVRSRVWILSSFTLPNISKGPTCQSQVILEVQTNKSKPNSVGFTLLEVMIKNKKSQKQKKGTSEFALSPLLSITDTQKNSKVQNTHVDQSNLRLPAADLYTSEHGDPVFFSSSEHRPWYITHQTGLLNMCTIFVVWRH